MNEKERKKKRGKQYLNDAGVYIVLCSLILPPPHICSFDILPQNYASARKTCAILKVKCAYTVHSILFLC